jgi:hypothetical protein
MDVNILYCNQIRDMPAILATPLSSLDLKTKEIKWANQSVSTYQSLANDQGFCTMRVNRPDH